MPPDDPPITLVPHATCLACGCLCDDIAVAVADRRVVGAERACRIGLPWFLAPHPGAGDPPARIEGRPVALEEALDRAAAILGSARGPVVWGLTAASVEAVGVALAVADRIGAVVDLAGSAGRAAQRAGFVRVGAVSSTLGEIRDRAEVVLFWGNHPDATHPRHAERYSVLPRGRFLTAARTVIVVDVEADDPVGAADVRIALDPGCQAAALAVLLALARGVALDPNRVARATGQPLGVWEDVIQRFRGVRSAAICFGPAASALDATGWDAALGLVRALNAEGRRCVGLGLGEPGNVAGAEATLLWQAGAPGQLDFGSGAPLYRPGEASLCGRLGSGAVDAVLAVGLDPRADLPPEARARLGAIPWVLVAAGACRLVGPGSGLVPTVAIDVGRLGLEVGGTVARVDGVMLPLRPPLADGERPTDATVLRALRDRWPRET